MNKLKGLRFERLPEERPVILVFPREFIITQAQVLRLVLHQMLRLFSFTARATLAD